jgi:hypothetical protein
VCEVYATSFKLPGEETLAGDLLRQHARYPDYQGNDEQNRLLVTDCLLQAEHQAFVLSFVFTASDMVYSVGAAWGLLIKSVTRITRY